jgi:uncharacterized Zn-finger protein
LFKDLHKKCDFDVNSANKRVKMCLREHIRKHSQTRPVILPIINFTE